MASESPEREAVVWDHRMTDAARVSIDAFLSLHHRRLGVVPHHPGDRVHQWSEKSFGCLAHVHDDLHVVPSLWRLINAALMVAEDPRVNPCRVYLEWHTLANLDDNLNASVEAALQRGDDIHWENTIAVVQYRVLTGDLQGAGELLHRAVQHLRTTSHFHPDEEVMVNEILALFINPFLTTADFTAWRQRAVDLLVDARHVLGEVAEDVDESSPFVLVKLQLLELLFWASGDRQVLAGRVDNLGLNAMWYIGGVAACIEPFATWPRLLDAFLEFVPSGESAWFMPCIEAALRVRASANAVDFAAAVLDLLPGDFTPHSRFAAHLLAAHVAEICAPPYAAVGASAKHAATRDRLVAAYAGHLTKVPDLWRIAALHLVYTPLNNPAYLADHLLRSAAAEYPGAAPVLAFIREFVEADSPLQVRLRAALRQRVPTAAESLSGVLANFDDCLGRASTSIRLAHAGRDLAAGRLSSALATWADLGRDDAVESVLSSRLDTLGRHGLTKHQVTDAALVRAGASIKCNLVARDGLAARSVALLDALTALVEVVPFVAPSARLSASPADVEAAVSAAAVGAASAYSGEAPVAALWFVNLAADAWLQQPYYTDPTVLLRLHAAAAGAAEMLEPVDSHLAERVLQKLLAIPRK
jgi:hypothetical protein